jgi:hypothetical protein
MLSFRALLRPSLPARAAAATVMVALTLAACSHADCATKTTIADYRLGPGTEFT